MLNHAALGMALAVFTVTMDVQTTIIWITFHNIRHTYKCHDYERICEVTKRFIMFSKQIYLLLFLDVGEFDTNGNSNLHH